MELFQRINAHTLTHTLTHALPDPCLTPGLTSASSSTRPAAQPLPLILPLFPCSSQTYFDHTTLISFVWMRSANQ